jgi:parvulin-like peptidyl-prolyl isomerase
MKKLIIITVLALSATAASAEIIEAVAIRVGDRIVTRTQYEQRLQQVYREIEQGAPAAQVAELKAQARGRLTQELIDELLIKDRADRLGLAVTPNELKQAIEQLKQQYNIATDEQFEQSLAASGMTRPDMESRLRETLLTNKVFGRELRNRQDLTDAELRERYNREKERYRMPERARIREIVVLMPEAPAAIEEARQRAADLAAAARKPGTNFANLALTMSESGSRDRGGDIGEVAKGDLVQELDAAVFNAATGTILGPIETRSGWHILLVEQRLPSEVPAFETIKDRLRRDADDETFQRDLKAYLESLRKDALVQVNDAMLPGA